jgi:uncharacterized membrane protein
MEKTNDNIPTGFKSNPSSWEKRKALLFLAVAGFFVALYLGLYELKVLETVWEPFFGNGTQNVLKSSFSKSLPIPDGILGAFGYLCDVILVSIGNESRWYASPWIVILYFLLVVLMALVSIFLIILQAFIVDAWCTLCLLSAVLSFSMVYPALTEFRATMHYLRHQKESGKDLVQAIEGK